MKVKRKDQASKK